MKNAVLTTAALVVAGGFAVAEAAAADEIGDFVVQQAYDAALGGDVAAAKEMMADDIFFTAWPKIGHPMWGGQPYLVGPEAVGAWWEFLAKNNARLEIVELAVEGNRAMFLYEFYDDHFSSRGIEPAMFEGYAFLRDGKIGGLMLAFTPELLDAMAATTN